jgi:hypothetical protein
MERGDGERGRDRDRQEDITYTIYMYVLLLLFNAFNGICFLILELVCLLGFPERKNRYMLNTFQKSCLKSIFCLPPRYETETPSLPSFVLGNAFKKR